MVLRERTQLYKVTNVLHVLHMSCMCVYTYMRNLKIYFVDQEREERASAREWCVCVMYLQVAKVACYCNTDL